MPAPTKPHSRNQNSPGSVPLPHGRGSECAGSQPRPKNSSRSAKISGQCNTKARNSLSHNKWRRRFRLRLLAADYSTPPPTVAGKGSNAECEETKRRRLRYKGDNTEQPIGLVVDPRSKVDCVSETRRPIARRDGPQTDRRGETRSDRY